MGRKKGLQSKGRRTSEAWQRSKWLSQEMSGRVGAARPFLAGSVPADQEILKLLEEAWVGLESHVSTHNTELTKVAQRLRKMLLGIY